MNTFNKKIYIFSALFIFIILPSLFVLLGDFPERTLLKNSISILIMLTFFIAIAQFYISRLNGSIKSFFKISKIIKLHKIIGYSILPILLIHPILVVVPRFFEVGVPPFEAFVRMITTIETLGVLLGIIAWILMLVLGLTSLFRDKLNISYKSWKVLHAILSLAFIVTASWHAIDLGRHMSTNIVILIISLSSIASILLLKVYLKDINKTEIRT